MAFFFRKEVSITEGMPRDTRLSIFISLEFASELRSKISSAFCMFILTIVAIIKDPVSEPRVPTSQCRWLHGDARLL